MKITTLYIFLFTLFLMACKKDQAISTTQATDVVVQSYLYPNKFASVTLSNLALFNTNQELTSIQNLTVSLKIGNNTTVLEYTGEGNYVATDSTLIQGGETVSLDVDAVKYHITSTTTIPTKPTNFVASLYEIAVPDLSTYVPGSGTRPTFPDPILLSWDNPDGSYYVVVVHCTEANPVAVNPNSTNNSDFGSSPSKFNTLSLRSQSFKYFGMNRVVLYKINPDYASLYTPSSNSSQSLTNPTTNVTNGYGIFTGVNSDTLFVNVLKQ